MSTINKAKIIEGTDFYFNENGLMVFTKEYHLKRGYCCKRGCLNCPYGFRKEKTCILDEQDKIEKEIKLP